MTRRRGSNILMECVPPLCQSPQPLVQFPEGSLCLEMVPGTLWTTANGWELEEIWSFPKMLPTNSSCLQYLCKAAYAGYTYPQLLCTRSAGAAQPALLQLVYLRFTPLVFNGSPCSDHSYSPFLYSLQT